MSEQFPFEHFLSNETSMNPLNIPSKNNNLEEKNKTNIVLDQSEKFSNDELTVIGTEILNYLKGSITTQKYSTYFENTFYLVELGSEKVIFSVTTQFIKNVINNSYLSYIKEAIANTLGRNYQVEITVVSSKESMSSNKNSILNSLKANPMQVADVAKSAKEAKFSLDLNQAPEEKAKSAESKYIDHIQPKKNGIQVDATKTFDNFIVGPENNMANATALSVAKNPGKSGKYPSLYIHSSPGLGKTHLLHAVANEIKSNHPHLVICLITAREFLKEMINSIRERNIDEFQKKYLEKVDVLMIDDIHELKNKEGTQNEFFHIFNELHNKGKQLIFTSDKPPKDIDGIEERVRSRLSWGLVVDIGSPNLETRIAILKRKAFELDLFLQDEVYTLIASNITANIRELEGSLIKLQAYADLMNVDLEMVQVKDLLGIESREEAKIITLDTVARAVSQHFKIPLADIKSKARGQHITTARHVGMYLSRKILNATQKEIGIFYGGRDHTSVIHAVNKVTGQLRTDLVLSRDLFAIENNL
ncbi:MAG: chromosomal replication initiator protein DnaA [Halobacteriovorax sp.]|nr:chromosomal replication initiator protein DnaA [Halobacteriovorax sp.]|tara:strand:+ start:342368 stop:343966 length:1599 start_codon:yes stop_codon:yes gene_type:complete